jgi:hypothetical protein
MGERGDLSWQQYGSLYRDARGCDRIPNAGALFALSDEVTLAQVRERLADLTRREDALRITEISDSVCYADEVEPPVHAVQVGSVEELGTLTSQMINQRFVRQGGPLWRLAVIDHPDGAGRAVRSVCTVSDHLISDARSQFVIRQAVRGESSAEAGRLRDWVARQRERFPMEPREASTRARDFWLRYLDGTSPDRATLFPFRSEGPPSGFVEVIQYELPTSITVLTAASRTLRTTPFSLILAAMAAAISAVTDENDITLQVKTTGRPPGYLDTLGCFADEVPIRIRDGSLAVPQKALRATTMAWAETLTFQTTPWDYILAACAPPETPPVVQRPGQVRVNFIPWTTERRWCFQTETGRVPAIRQAFHLSVVVGVDGRCHLRCDFDPERYTAGGVDDFLQVMLDGVRALIRDARR